MFGATGQAIAVLLLSINANAVVAKLLPKSPLVISSTPPHSITNGDLIIFKSSMPTHKECGVPNLAITTKVLDQPAKNVAAYQLFIVING